MISPLFCPLGQDLSGVAPRALPCLDAFRRVPSGLGWPEVRNTTHEGGPGIPSGGTVTSFAPWAPPTPARPRPGSGGSRGQNGWNLTGASRNISAAARSSMAAAYQLQQLKTSLSHASAGPNTSCFITRAARQPAPRRRSGLRPRRPAQTPVSETGLGAWGRE